MRFFRPFIAATLAVLLALPAQAFVFNTPGEKSAFQHPFGSLFDTKSGLYDQADGIAFEQGLFVGYSALSDELGNNYLNFDWDFVDAELFNFKARSAAADDIVLPENPLDRDLTEEERTTFFKALRRLRQGFEKGGRTIIPAQAARAQVAYDCWIVSVDDGDPEKAEICQAEFEEAMDQVEAVATTALTEFPSANRADAVSATSGAVESFFVYFDFDRSNILTEGSRAIGEILTAALADPELTVRITAHTDTVGTLDYNQALSERRANAVIGALVEGGISPDRIVSVPVGKTQPLVPTPDGVREQFNRVAEVDLL